MLQLLMVVLAILLLAAVVSAGMVYVNFDSGQRYVSAQMVSMGFQSWERAYTAFRMANRVPPMVSADLVPFLPSGRLKAPSGLAWGFGRDATGSFICLFGATNSENDLAALLRLGDNSSKVTAVPASSISFGDQCGGSGPFAVGMPLAVTYRLTN